MNIGIDKDSKKRIKPEKGKSAICQCCGLELIPKCGKINRHHWAHKDRSKCDRWWESETDWHRDWKDNFPIDWQEVIKIDSETGEKHIADIFNEQKNLVIEFQNSSISVEEIEAREKFYGKMIWVVNAISFQIETFPIENSLKRIEDLEIRYLQRPRMNSYFKVPTSVANNLINRQKRLLAKPFLKESDIGKLYHLLDQEILSLVSQHKTGDPKLRGRNPNQFRIDLFRPILSKLKQDIAKTIERNKKNDKAREYFGYEWSRKRKTWEFARKPIFMDCGEKLFFLKSDWELKMITKERFIKRYGPAETIPDSNFRHD